MEQEVKQKKYTTFANEDCDKTDDDDNDSAWVTVSTNVVAVMAGILFNYAATASIVNNANHLTDIQPLTIPRVRGVGGSACNSDWLLE